MTPHWMERIAQHVCGREQWAERARFVPSRFAPTEGENDNWDPAAA